MVVWTKNKSVVETPLGYLNSFYEFITCVKSIALRNLWATQTSILIDYSLLKFYYKVADLQNLPSHIYVLI